MLYERHGDYEILEWDNNGECGVWMYPSAMDEVDPVIVLPTVEAARIWVQKKLAPAPAADSAATPTKAYHYNGGAIVWVNGFAAIKQLVEDCTGAKDAGFLQETLDAIYGIAIYELASKEAQTSAAADVSTWTLPTEMVTPEVKAVLERLQAANAINAERGNDFEAETERLEAELARVKAALEPFKHEWDTYQNYAKEQDGRADVGNYLTNYRDLDVIMSACRRAATALQASAPPADGESGGGG